MAMSELHIPSYAINNVLSEKAGQRLGSYLSAVTPCSLVYTKDDLGLGLHQENSHIPPMDQLLQHGLDTLGNSPH